MTNEMMMQEKAFVEATIALFKGVPAIEGEVRPVDEERLAKNGIVFGAGVKSALPAVGDYVGFMVEKHGFDLMKANAGFHKSFAKVRDAEPMQLFVEQILHYTSVFFQNGLDDRSPEEINSGYVFIPAEELSLPEGAESVRMTVIRALTDKEIVQRAKSMLSGGMALKQDTQDYLMAIVRRFMDKFSLDEVRNKEFKIRMIDELGFVPTSATDLVRYIVFKKTGLPMVVHSHRSVGAFMRNPSGFDATRVVKSFVEKFGVESIAKQFNRHRNFWVAMKKDGAEIATIINKARRLSNTLNKPAKIGVLDRIGDKSVTLAEVKAELPKVTLFKKVSLANSMLRRTGNPTAALYTVRTGRSFAKQSEGATSVFMTPARIEILNAVIDSIVEEVRPNIEGKTVHLQDGMDYAFPTSEKQFVGNIPFYSTFSVDGSAIVGIHWTNVKGKEGRNERVDLDLHYTSDNYHIGWNDAFTSAARNSVFHSGDLTNAPAPNGASEAVYVSDKITDDFAALSVCQYTRNSVPVPYSIYVGSADMDKLSKKYLISANEVCTNINGMVSEYSDTIIGFIESSEEGKKLHFFDSALGTGIVSSYDKNHAAALEAVKSTLATRLSLKDVLEKAGAKFEREDDETPWDIDLSFEALTKDSWSFLTAKEAKKN